MQVGSCGVIYCSATQALTTPFLVYSKAAQERVVHDVWPEPWSLPFDIHPLGTPRRALPKDEAMEVLEVARTSGKSNITHVLPIPAVTVFSPKEVPTDDWATLIDRLGD